MLGIANQRPLTESFALAYAYDPAFDTDRPDYADEYRRCVATLDFSSITKPGQVPTWFHFRPITDREFRTIFSYSGLGLRYPWLVCRLALIKIEDGADIKIERSVDGEYRELGKLVNVSLMDKLGALSMVLGRDAGELINDFGAEVVRRSSTVSPL